MIAELTGVLAGREEGGIVLDVAGVGYAVRVSSKTLAALPPIGGRVHLYTHLIVREDAWILVGFGSPRERSRFLDLLAVTGIGVRHALAVLSFMDVEGLEAAVREGKWRRIAEVPGIGAKTAQRLQLELANRWKLAQPDDAEEAPATPAVTVPQDPVLAGLVSLGFGAQEAWAVLTQLPADLAPEEKLREALRRLDRR